jgi:hypothetical protein
MTPRHRCPQPLGRAESGALARLARRPEHDLWLFRCGETHGLAHNDGECVTRMPYSASGAVLNAVRGRGIFAKFGRDVDFDRNPVTFTRG